MKDETTLEMCQFTSRTHNAGHLLRKLGRLADMLAGTPWWRCLKRRKLCSEFDSLSFALANELCAALDAFAEIDFEDLLQDERGREALGDVQDYIARRFVGDHDDKPEGDDREGRKN